MPGVIEAPAGEVDFAIALHGALDNVFVKRSRAARAV